MSTLLASRLKKRRKELKMSQSELADGICKQGQISRLENGEYSPGSELLHDLAKKLKVSMDYFFEENIVEDLSELSEFKKLAQTFIFHRNYESLKYIYDLEAGKPHRLSLEDKIYMGWIHSLITFYLYEKQDEAIFQLEQLLQQVDTSDLNYLQISNTLFNFYYDTDNFERFKEIQIKLEKQVTKLKINTIDELKLSIKFNYNICRYLWLQNNIQEAISKIIATIKQCREYHTTYLLADLHLLMGNISKDFSDHSVVKEYFKTAHLLYKLDENLQMAMKVEHYMIEID